MSVRRKLLILLSGFAVFAVLAAAATIYGVRWQMGTAVRNFERSMGFASHIERLQFALEEQLFHLRQMVAGSEDAVKAYFQTRDEFFTKLRQAARYARELEGAGDTAELLRLADTFERESDRCLALLQDSQNEQAAEVLTMRLERELAPELASRLLRAQAPLEEARNRATRELGTTSTHVLALTVGVGLSAAALVLVAAMWIRRWLIVPMLDLQEAARRFSDGELAHRVRARSDDELGRLGTALNEMAASVEEAQCNLRASETKYRSLFRNLRDAVVICEADAHIVECHDSDTHTLGVETEGVAGRHVLDVWPEWSAATGDFSSVLASVVLNGKRWRALDVPLSHPEGGDEDAYADFLVYRVEFGGARYAAIVVRDVTERQQWQRRLWRADTMEALGTLAGGLAHDFNNLLAGINGTLSNLASEMADTPHAERLRQALRACRHAAGLSKRLLSFAKSAHGEPQVFPVGETTALIVNSIDPSYFEGVTVRLDLDTPVNVRMDRDQFTEVAMNLVRNAREAMPEGGTLRIAVESSTTRDPTQPTLERPYAVLVIQDDGVGMTPEVRQRIFEPLFTTKSRESSHGRGLGMAVVYSAVKHAGGFIQLDSDPGSGTTFRVFLPACDERPKAEDLPEAPPDQRAEQPEKSAGSDAGRSRI
jgi:signal transduction histidine kinase